MIRGFDAAANFEGRLLHSTAHATAAQPRWPAQAMHNMDGYLYCQHKSPAGKQYMLKHLFSALLHMQSVFPFPAEHLRALPAKPASLRIRAARTSTSARQERYLHFGGYHPA
jgi:hypothetical protein